MISTLSKTILFMCSYDLDKIKIWTSKYYRYCEAQKFSKLTILLRTKMLYILKTNKITLKIDVF